MQRGGGGWRQDSGHTQSDQRAAEADDEAVVGVDARHQRHGEASQFYQFLKAVGSDGDVRDLPGDGGTVADGDARVRLGQGRRVVDTVAHHQDSMPLPAEPGHILRFVCRKDSGAEVVHSHLGGNGCGGAVTVADEYKVLAMPWDTRYSTLEWYASCRKPRSSTSSAIVPTQTTPPAIGNWDGISGKWIPN